MKFASAGAETVPDTLGLPAGTAAEDWRESSTRKLFIGVPIDCLSLAETVASAGRAVESRETLQHVCLNVAKFVAMRTDHELDRDVRSSHIVSVDGMGVVWAARLLGITVPERVAGVDVMEGVLRLCATHGYRPYLLGGRAHILQAAVGNIRKKYPQLEFAGSHNGYFNLQEESSVASAIKASRADCLFIGMPTPRKERFVARYCNELGVPFVMGVGGAFDVLGRHVRRAPRPVQRMGLEWLFRAVQEPLRLGPRYVVTNTIFAGIAGRAVISKWMSQARG